VRICYLGFLSRKTNVKTLGAHIIRVAALLAILLAPAIANDQPAVTDAEVYRARGLILSDLHCTRMISEHMAGTVQSGLPAVIELRYTLRDENDKSIAGGLNAYELQYDVWDDIYTVDHGDTTVSLRSFDDLGRFVRNLKRIAIVPLEDLNATMTYSIHFSISVHALRSAQRDRIVGWVDDTVRNEAGESLHEQMLNVNGLIHRFFKRDGSKPKQLWYTSPSFRPSTLPSRTRGEDQ